MRFVITLGVIFLLSSCGIDDTIDGNDGDNGSSSDWEKEWGSEDVDRLYSIAVSPDDTVYVGGKTFGDLYSEKEGESDAFLAAFNLKGKELWGKQWSVKDDRSDVQGLVVDDAGNIYAGGGDNPFIMKFSPDGTKIWEKFPEVDSVLCLALDNSGNVYAGTGYGDILKFSPEGKELWHYNISTEDAEGEIKALAVDSEGNIYAGGTTWGSLFEENAGGTDAFLVKIAPDGAHVWKKQWGGKGDDSVYAIAADGTKNIYVAAGSFEESEVLAKYSPEGKKIWGYTEEQSHYSSIAIDNENSIYFGSGGYNDRIHRYNSDGEKIWSSNDAGETKWSAIGIALDSNGNLYICGGAKENHLKKILASEMK